MNEPHDFKELDHLLMNEAAPRAPHDLAERIVYRAARTPQTARPARTGILGEFSSFLAVPRPALAFGLCLMLGMFSGWSVTQHVEAGDATGDAAQAIDMVVIEEEWL